MNELDELRNEVYKNDKIYKDKTKAFYDKTISCKSFEANQKVWLFNSQLKLFPTKLRCRWNGPFVIQQVLSSGAVQILDPQNGWVLIVNGQHLKSILIHDIDTAFIESINLADPVYYD